MQKLYSLIAALLVSVVSTFAGTVTINVNVGDVCTLSYWDSTTYDQVSMTLTEGQNRY